MNEVHVQLTNDHIPVKSIPPFPSCFNSSVVVMLAGSIGNEALWSFPVGVWFSSKSTEYFDGKHPHVAVNTSCYFRACISHSEDLGLHVPL